MIVVIAFVKKEGDYGCPRRLCIKIKSSDNAAIKSGVQAPAHATLSMPHETPRCSKICCKIILKEKTNSRHRRHRPCFSCNGSIPRLSAALSLTSAARRRGSGCGPAGARPAPAAISKQIKHVAVCIKPAGTNDTHLSIFVCCVMPHKATSLQHIACTYRVLTLSNDATDVSRRKLLSL